MFSKGYKSKTQKTSLQTGSFVWKLGKREKKRREGCNIYSVLSVSWMYCFALPSSKIGRKMRHFYIMSIVTIYQKWLPTCRHVRYNYVPIGGISFRTTLWAGFRGLLISLLDVFSLEYGLYVLLWKALESLPVPLPFSGSLTGLSSTSLKPISNKFIVVSMTSQLVAEHVPSNFVTSFTEAEIQLLVLQQTTLTPNYYKSKFKVSNVLLQALWSRWTMQLFIPFYISTGYIFN